MMGKNPTGAQLTQKEKSEHTRIIKGIDEIYATGNLQSKPALIIHGRDDALIAVNHTSRYYYGLNKTTQQDSRLSYIEVTNANHLDALNQYYESLRSTQIPLHYYFHLGLDLMYAHLRTKGEVALPRSQVVPTRPSKDPLKRYLNLPDIDTGPEVRCPIEFGNNVLTVPTCEGT